LNEKYNNIPLVALHHYYNAMRIMILKRKRILIAIAENLNTNINTDTDNTESNTGNSKAIDYISKEKIGALLT